MTAPRALRHVPDVAPPSDRRVLIADAALTLLAREGARGLTHRAVDRELGLPDGSTSYYFSTRAALLLAAAERLVELDAAEIAALPPGFEGVVELVERWLSPRRRTRSLARLELLLTAARDPVFDFMRQARAQFIAQVKQASRETDAAKAAAEAVGLVALVDGLVVHGLVSGDLPRQEARRVLEQARRRAEPRRAASARRPARRPTKSKQAR